MSRPAEGIQAMGEFAGEVFDLDGARLILLRTHVVDDRTSAEPGKVVDVTRDAIHVATGHGGVIGIDELQAEGKRPLRTRDFLAGRPLQPGGRFT